MYYAKHEHATFLIASARLSSEKRDQIKKIVFQHTQQFLDCVNLFKTIPNIWNISLSLLKNPNNEVERSISSPPVLWSLFIKYSI